MFPKLKALLLGSPLKGIDAHQWDAQTLSEEQNLAQSMYNGLSDETLTTFETYAKKNGAAWLALDLHIAHDHFAGGKWHSKGVTPEFIGDIRKIDDRYKYGMLIASKFSVHSGFPWWPNLERPPMVGPKYTNGGAYESLNKFRNLHKLDSVLDDMHVSEEDEERIIEIIQRLSKVEQQDLGTNEERVLLLVSHLSSAQREQALLGLKSVSEKVRATLLGTDH